MVEARKNSLMPTTAVVGRLTPFHVVSTSEVVVDLSETYPIEEWENGKKTVMYGLAKVALTRIAQAAGIEFLVDKCGAVGTPTKEYLSYRSVCRMRLNDGTYVERPGTVEWFYEEEVAPFLEESEKLFAEATEAAKTAKNDAERKAVATLRGKAYGKSKAGHEALKKRMPMCETKSMLRAIRFILPIKGKYTADELKGAFDVPRVDIVPDVENPAVLELIKHGTIDLQSALYGQRPMQSGAPALAPAPSPFEELPPAKDEEPEDAGFPEPVDEGESTQVEPEGEAHFDDFAVDKTSGEVRAFGATEVTDDDPGMYKIQDVDSNFVGWQLYDVESDAPGYVKQVVKRQLGSQELQDQCLRYLEKYDEEGYVEVATRG